MPSPGVKFVVLQAVAEYEEILGNSAVDKRCDCLDVSSKMVSSRYASLLETQC